MPAPPLDPEELKRRQQAVAGGQPAAAPPATARPAVGPAASPAPAHQSFSQIQANGMARPAPPPYVTSAPGSNAAGVEATMGRMAGDIDSQYANTNQGIEEEMARRGISASNITGDRMRFANTQRRDAKTALADSLLERLANENRADRSLNLQEEDSRASRGLQSRGLDIQEQQAIADRLLRKSGMDEDIRRFDLNRGDEIGRDTRDFAEGGRRFDLNYGLQKDQFGFDRERDARDFTEGRRRFDTTFDENRRQYDDQSSRSWYETLGGNDYTDVPGSGATDYAYSPDDITRSYAPPGTARRATPYLY